MLDCCYSGAFLKGFRARGDDSVPVQQLEGRGRAVITASRATEYAFETNGLAAENPMPSLFTGAVVEGLSSGRADTNGDGLVTVNELYDYVFDMVRDKVDAQTPGCWIGLEGDLVVARNPGRPSPSPPSWPRRSRAGPPPSGSARSPSSSAGTGQATSPSSRWPGWPSSGSATIPPPRSGTRSPTSSAPLHPRSRPGL